MGDHFFRANGVNPDHQVWFQSTAPTRCSRDWRYANLHATRRITTILHCNMIHLALQLACCTTACTSSLRCFRRACGASRLLNVRVGSPGCRRPPARAGTAPPDAGQVELPADKKPPCTSSSIGREVMLTRGSSSIVLYRYLKIPLMLTQGDADGTLGARPVGCTLRAARARRSRAAIGASGSAGWVYAAGSPRAPLPRCDRRLGLGRSGVRRGRPGGAAPARDRAGSGAPWARPSPCPTRTTGRCA
jgi:hypothetical protein